MNIQEIDKWLKEKEGISYAELGKEFNDAVELSSKCAKKSQEKSKEIERLKEENDIATEKVKSAIKEIERLNNIINDFESWLKAHLDDEFYWFKMYDKLQELKGSNSNENL